VNLAGVEVHDVERGQALVTTGAFVDARLADASVEVLPGAKPLKHGARVRFHQGTAEILGRVAIVGPGDADRAPTLQPGARGFVRLRLEAPAVVARGDRYILRAYSPPVTIAGGLILDPSPPRSAIRSAAALERARRLDFDPAGADRAAADLRALVVMLDDAGATGLPVSALTTRASIDPARVDAVAGALVAGKHAVRAGSILVASAIEARLADAIVAALADHHTRHPLSEGIPREELRDQLFARGSAAVFDAALDRLAGAKTIAVRDRVALASHRLELTPDEDRARAAIERLFLEGGLTPPDAAGIAAAAGVPSAVADRMLKLLQRQKVLVRVDVLLFHDAALKRLKSEVSGLKTTAGAAARIDVATFKERFGVTRKFAIPLLEYLDRERVTRRMGESRVVL
jgi:selenocysteine-specific elongation factor